jgi:hypothetical protein
MATKKSKTSIRKMTTKDTADARPPAFNADGSLAAGIALVLRSCRPDMTSHDGFRWPESGTVSAPDWEPTEECGHGLHGFLWGEGDGALADWNPEARWLVVTVLTDELIDLVGKVKFPRGEVVYCGDRISATAYLARFAFGRAIVGGTATAGDTGTATAGYRGTATAGYRGTATAGDGGILSIRWWDEQSQRYRLAVGYVSEAGIEPDRPYRVDGGRFVAVSDDANVKE